MIALKFKYHPILLGLLFVFQACDTGLYITKSKKLAKEGGIEKIVSIEPRVKLISQNPNVKNKKSFLKEVEFTNNIQNACKRNGIDVLMYDLDNGPVEESYFNGLCLLRSEVLQKMSVQLNRQDSLESNAENTKTKLGFSAPIFFFTDGIGIDMQYHYLAPVFGTKYFSVQGLYRVKNSVFFINVVVDVLSSQFVYTEVRRLLGSPSRKNMVPVLYDSFAILKHKVK